MDEEHVKGMPEGYGDYRDERPDKGLNEGLRLRFTQIASSS